MSDNKRVIKINTDLFKIPHATRKNRNPPADGAGKIRVKSQVKEQNNATLKRKLMKFIRSQHDKKMKESEPTAATDTFNTEFKGSLDYLSNMTKQVTGGNNRTLKSYGPLPKINILSDLPPALTAHIVTPTHTPAPVYTPPRNPMPAFIPTHAPAPVYNPTPVFIPTPAPLNPTPTFIPTPTPAPVYAPPPSYGCLKGGSLPLYRNHIHNQTQKNNAIAPPLRISDLSNPVSINHIKQITERMNEINTSKPRPRKQKRTVRRTYKIGRSKVFPKVSVLVSNRTIRNNITTKSQLLKQTPIGEVKKHLIKTGFIKVGSIAPNDVLRKMYETTTLMCGEVTNHNPEYLLHNFMNN
jgi:hypothetical protein